MLFNANRHTQCQMRKIVSVHTCDQLTTSETNQESDTTCGNKGSTIFVRNAIVNLLTQTNLKDIDAFVTPIAIHNAK